MELNALKFTRHNREIPIIIIRPKGHWNHFLVCTNKKVKISGIFCVVSVVGWRMNIWGLNCSIFFYPELVVLGVGAEKGWVDNIERKENWDEKLFVWSNENNPGWNLGCEESRMRHAKHIKWNFHYLWKLSGAWRTSTGRKDSCKKHCGGCFRHPS